MKTFIDGVLRGERLNWTLWTLWTPIYIGVIGSEQSTHLETRGVKLYSFYRDGVCF